MRLDRREFFELATGALAAAALPGCASLVFTRVTPRDGAVRLPLRNLPQLARPGGYLRILPEGTGAPLYVLALDDGRYSVLSPICTHLGCTVAIAGAQLPCPCHGSTFDRQGRVLRGPAERSLRRFPATVTPEGELLIELESTP